MFYPQLIENILRLIDVGSMFRSGYIKKGLFGHVQGPRVRSGGPGVTAARSYNNCDFDYCNCVLCSS